MPHLATLIAAYVLTGLAAVTQSAKEPSGNRPSALQSTSGTAAMLLLWPVVAMAHGAPRLVAFVTLFALFVLIGEAIGLLT